MRFKKPPQFQQINTNDPQETTKQVVAHQMPDNLEEFQKTIDTVRAIQASKNYQSYYDLYHKYDRTNVDKIWFMVKSARFMNSKSLFTDIYHQFYYLETSPITNAIIQTERFTTQSALKEMAMDIGEDAYFKSLLEGLLTDEAISSSQFEGAATTTLDAKRMLKKKAPAKTEGEKMVIGNYKMMSHLWENREKTLDLDFILELHQIGTDGINDEHYTPSFFRTTDNIVVSDGSNNEIIHQPPPASLINKALKEAIDWINASNEFHPLTKAIVLHFIIGFLHLFRDGNGRVARALFYWVMFKHDYPIFRYLSISKLLTKRPKQYVIAYLNTEHDDFDLTYFLEFNCKIVIEAIEKFRDYYQTIKQQNSEFNNWFVNSGAFEKLDTKQKTILNIARQKLTPYFTVNDVANYLDCSDNTARTVLNELVNQQFFKKKKEGKGWIYTIKKIDEIMKTKKRSVI